MAGAATDRPLLAVEADRPAEVPVERYGGVHVLGHEVQLSEPDSLGIALAHTAYFAV